MPARRFLLLRHTETRHPRALNGWIDAPLSEAGEGAIPVIAETVAGHSPVAVFSSDLSRAWRLGTAIAERSGLPAPEPIQELREQRFGRWEGENWDDKMKGPEREAVQNLLRNFLEEKPPEGESFRELSERVLRGWKEVLLRAEGPGPFVLTTHSGPVRVLLCHARNIPLEKAFDLKVPFGSLHEISVLD